MLAIAWCKAGPKDFVRGLLWKLDGCEENFMGIKISEGGKVK